MPEPYEIDQEEKLLDDTLSAEAVQKMMDGPAWHEYKKFLTEIYITYVMSAVRESQKYGAACRAIEQVIDFTGQKIDAGKAAEAILHRIEGGITDEDY